MRQLIAAVAIVLIIVVPRAFAQVDDGCRDVLSYSARNFSFETAELGTALKVYQQYCHGESVRSGTNFDAGLDAVIKAVPVKFNLSSGGTEERTKHFCKTFDSDYKHNESYYRSISQVVNETTNAWLTCKTRASQGILFRPNISATQIVIEVARTNAWPASVEGIIYDHDQLSCTVPSSDASKFRTTADEKTVKSLTEAYWPVTCIRQPQKQPAETIYPKVDISIGTTRGSFLLPVMSEAMYPYQWSSDLQRQMHELGERTKSTIKSVQSAVDSLKDEAAKQVIQVKVVTLQHSTCQRLDAVTFSCQIAWDRPFSSILSAHLGRTLGGGSGHAQTLATLGDVNTSGAKIMLSRPYQNPWIDQNFIWPLEVIGIGKY